MKTADLTMVYGAAAVFSALLMVSYLLWEKRKERSFLLLTFCVAAVNCGYFFLSVAGSLPFAMVANALSYFGAAYSVLSMMWIVCDVCQVKLKKPAYWALLAVSTAAFGLAASGDWLGLYYRSVGLANVNGVTKLVKVYGPLHIVYTVYLLSYVLGMVAVIFCAWKRQRLSSPKYTMLLMTAVLLNIGVWAVEQAVDIDFEFLSVSYIVTEVILLLLHGLLQDYGIIQPGGSLVSVQMLTQLYTRQTEQEALPPDMEELLGSFARKVKTLTPAERRILGYYIDGYETAQVPDLAYISIHTVKKHNRSIYQKLEVASRDELMLYIELFRCCGRLDELTEIA